MFNPPRAANQHAMNRVQHTIEDASNTEYDAHTPLRERRKLSSLESAQSYAETSYENTHTYGNARAHYGDVYNSYMGYTQPPSLPFVSSHVRQDHQSPTSDAVGLIKALRFEHMDSRFASIRAAHTGTCEWLFAKEEYGEWRDSSKARMHHGFLWIKGKPGTGKSTFMKSAYVRYQKTHTNKVTVSHFFSARGSLLHHSAEGMYRSLLCQLLERFPQLSSSLEDLGLRLDHDCAVWHKDHLETLLREAVLNLPSKYMTCYVDAINECEYADAQDIIDFLQELHRAAQHSGTGFSVLISSRHFPQLSQSHEGCLQITLDHVAEHEADLSLYLCAKLRLGESSKAQRIRELIRQRSSGIFLWAVLIIRILNEDKARGRVHLLEDHLDSLPEDLNHLFGDMLQHDAGDKSALLLTIQWLLFADRPLRLEEVYFAVVTNGTSDDIAAWNRDEVNIADMKNFVLNTSNGLVEVTEGAVPTVQLIHGTVRDYLINTWLPSRYAQPMIASISLCHDQLWRCCRNYVLRSSPVLLRTSKHGINKTMSRCFRAASESRSQINKSHPFLEHALHGMVLHANVAQSLGVQQQDFTRDFPLNIWVRLHNNLVVNPADRMSDKTTLEYIFVTKNAAALVEVLIKQESGLASTQLDTKRERYQSLLGAAVAKGYNEMVALLLEHGANPNSQVNGNFECLDTAAMQGNASIVRMLLDFGVAVQGNARDLQETQPSPLRLAAEAGHTEVVAILLEHPDYASQWYPEMDCVLEAAVYRRDGNMMRLLHGKLCPAKRAIAGALYAANHASENNGDREVNMFRAIHSFRTYYQTRERGEPALLDTICRAFKDCVQGPSRAFQSLNVWHHRSAAAMGTVSHVLTLLQRQSLQLPVAMMQLERRPLMVEDFFAIPDVIDTTSVAGCDRLNEMIAEAIDGAFDGLDYEFSRYCGVLYSNDGDFFVVRPPHADTIYRTGYHGEVTGSEWAGVFESGSDNDTDFEICFAFDAEKGKFVNEAGEEIRVDFAEQEHEAITDDENSEDGESEGDENKVNCLETFSS